MPHREIDKANDLLKRSIGSSSMTEDRRQFHDQVIRLGAIDNLECKTYFGSMVQRYFKEFDDMQDRAVDAILDLCEDDHEKTRDLGIKALKNTAKADPRWVKSNTGVLLQLLGGSTGAELEHVKTGLSELLSINPSDAIRAIVDECLDSADGPGTPRRYALQFLLNNAAAQRQDILESGRYVDVEESFLKGFEGVLKVKPGSADIVSILKLLIPLSIFSGKNATQERTGDFCRLMMDSISSTAPNVARQDVVLLFEDLVERTSVLEPREALRNVRKHSDTIASMALVDDDKGAKRLVDRLEGWVEASIAAWRRRTSDEYPEDKIASGFAKTLLGDVLDTVSLKSFKLDRPSALVLEKLLYAIFTLQKLKDRRRDIVRGSQLRDLDDLAADAKYRANKVKGEERDALENVETIAKWLTKTTSSTLSISPSWKTRGEQFPAPTSQSSQDRGPQASGPSGVRDAPAKPPSTAIPASTGQTSAVVEPRAERKASPLPSAGDRHSQQADRTVPNRSSDSTQSKSSGAQLPSGPSASSSNGRPKSSTGSGPIVLSDERLPLSKRFTKEESSMSAQPIATCVTAQPEETSGQATQKGRELLPHLLMQVEESAGGGAGKELLPHLSTLPPKPSTSQPGSNGQNIPLSERLGKRVRDDEAQAVTAPRRSLLDRISKDGSAPQKKARPSLEIDKNPLSQRLSGNSPAPSPSPQTPSLPKPPINEGPAPGKTLSIRNAASQPPSGTPQQLSIFGHRDRSTPTPTPAPAPATSISATESPFSIKNRSAVQAPAPGPAPKTEDEPVRRKGRGFQQAQGLDWALPGSASPSATQQVSEKWTGGMNGNGRSGGAMGQRRNGGPSLLDRLSK